MVKIKFLMFLYVYVMLLIGFTINQVQNYYFKPLQSIFYIQLQFTKEMQFETAFVYNIITL